MKVITREWLNKAQDDLNVIDAIIDSRYPVDLGLLPDGKPTAKDAFELYEFAKQIYNSANKLLESDHIKVSTDDSADDKQ